MRLLAIFWLLCMAAVAADEARIVVHTQPPSRIYLEGSTRRLLGRSGETLTLPLPLPGDYDVKLRARAEGYDDYLLTVSSRTLRSEPVVRVPSQGVVQMVANRWSTWLLSIATPLLLTVGIAGAVGWHVSRRRAEARAAQEALDRYAALGLPTQPMEAPQVGGYVLREVLGRGGMGCVFRGEGAGGDVAIKMLHVQIAQDSEYVERFRREADLMRRLSHPNIVRVLDAGTDPTVYMVMERIEGTSLRVHLAGRPVSDQMTWQLLKPLLDAVAYVHDHGIVHRDLKPDNVLITAGAEVKVTDFGVARGAPFQTLTAAGMVHGTPGYMAPEQFETSRVGPAADQYALGVMAFEMLMGHRPFEADDPMALYAAQRSTPPPDLPGSRLRQVVHRMLARAPEDRYPGLRACAAAAEAALVGGGS